MKTTNNAKTKKPINSDLHLRGLTTISPPAKVKIEDSPAQVLASGIDSLNLAIDVHWLSTELFSYLSILKETAKNTRKDTLGFFVLENDKDQWPFQVKPHGKNGYEWMLTNKEFTLVIGSWKRPQSKPSVLAEIRSETLWHLGAENAVEKIIEILLSQGGTRITIKPSRVDLCADVLLLEKFWNIDLIELATTRSTYMAPHFTHKKMTGLSIGRGKLCARLYDKPLEIRQQSKKFWMYDIWGIEEVPKDRKIIRVEFQLRRGSLTELAVNDIDDLFSHHNNLWGYCSQNWLKFQTNPGKHHTQRKTLDWWQIVQNGFLGVQSPTPLIRSKVLHYDIDQNTTQALGHIRSLIAAKIAAQKLDEYVPAEIEDGLKEIIKVVKKTPESEAEFAESIKEKKAKFHRTLLRHINAENERKTLGFPTAK